MIRRSLKIFLTALPFILSFIRDFRRFVFFGSRHRRDLEFHRHRAGKLTKKIASLGPSFIKLTQVISTRADIIPPLYLNELSKLHDEVPPVSFEVVKKVLEDEYNRPFEEVFESFDPTPLAAASLAQVHSGKYQGVDVAVKVQRPGIHEMVATDLRIIQRLLKILIQLFESYQLRALQVVVNEFSRTIFDEMDFEKESINVKRFQNLMKDRPDVLVPSFYPELTTPKVLVMRYYHGIKITDFDKLRREGIDVDRVLSKLIELYAQQILLDGIVHADPHPGNILVTREEKIVLLDYGLVVELDAETRKELIETTLAGARRDFDRLIEGYYNLGIANRELSTAVLREAAETIFDILSQEGITQRKIQEIAFDIIESFYAFPFELPSNLVYIFKTAALVEGIGTQYRYDFNAVKDIVPLARRVLREEKTLSPCKRIEDEFQKLHKMYRDLGDVLAVLRREEWRVRIHPVTISQTERYVARVFRRAIVAVLAAALSMVSAILYMVNRDILILSGGLVLAGMILLLLIVVPIPSTYGFTLWGDLGKKKRRQDSD
jgi:predicted unusual protein kinase regulating ubiquinone biosynthesis (AarF/ABC1/UbiB family)